MPETKRLLTVTFLPSNKTTTVQANETLITAARKAGLHINASCGGAGVCGKCTVIIEQGAVTNGNSEKISEEQFRQGRRQACTSIITEDITVRIPEESGRQTGGLSTEIPLRHHARMHVFNIDALRQEGIFDPPVSFSTGGSKMPSCLSAAMLKTCIRA